MRKLTLLIAVAAVAAVPSFALAKGKAKAAPPQTFESLNRDGLKVLHDVFIWPNDQAAKPAKHKKMKMAKKKK
jgi:hypothetical protein